ncbi:MAG: hypothetical protein R3C05_06160 [Pirellulaceae bacterium]
MLELVIAGSMLAAVMTSLSTVMRTARLSWDAADNDYAALHQAHSVARHFVRAVRESTGVNQLQSNGTDIELRMRGGGTASWRWAAQDSNGLNNVVILGGSTVPTETTLAHNVDRLRFVGYKADGVTVAATADDIHLLEVTVVVTLPRKSGSQKQVHSKVWIRSW